ncbi:MAG: SDR family NAD(P)-dependent oxidoreductase [Chloroflexi bacterium]|nr:SDR family NAD(P)-dependent oxidoreductase [Chloroflexota bacterium]
MGNRLEGKVAVVSGGGRGIGRAVALLLAEEGAQVVVNDLGCEVDGTGASREPADRTVAEIARLGGKAIASYEDVSTMAGGEAVVKRAVAAFGRLDILVNSVGVRRDRRFLEMTPDDWDAVVRHGLKGYFTTTRYACALMRQQRSGRIVNLTSDAGLGSLGMSNYAAASEGVIGLTRTVARDLGRYGVACNAVSAMARTRLFPDSPGDPESVAPLVAYLCGDGSPNANGYVFGSRGGDCWLYTEPLPERSIYKAGLFTIEELEELVPRYLLAAGALSPGGAGPGGRGAGRRLEGRVAVVTGGGGGIGRGVVRCLAREGAKVVVNDLGPDLAGRGTSQGPADAAVEEVRGEGGEAVACYDSVADDEGAMRIVQRALSSYGRLDIVCHLAGVLRDRMVFNMTEEEWDGVLRVHLYGAFHIVRHAVPHLVRQRYGRILLFSSRSGLGNTGQANYSAAKEGMVGFARALAQELAPYGVPVNAVYPSGATRMTHSVPETTRQLRSQLGIASPALRRAEGGEERDPERNAPKSVYLCTEGAGFITGQVVYTGELPMAVYPPRRACRAIHKEGRWTLEELEELVPRSLTQGLPNPAPPEGQAAPGGAGG